MGNLVQNSFLEWIHQQHNHQRLSNYKAYDSYYNGDQDVQIPKKIKAALDSELGTVSNFSRAVVDVAVDHLSSGEPGIEVTGEAEAVAKEAEKLLYDIYEANNLLDEELIKTLTIMGKKGDVFLKVYLDQDETLAPVERIRVKVLRPEIVFPRYSNDDYSHLLYVAIKWFEESEESKRKAWKAQVFRSDVVEYYELGESVETQFSQWKLIATEPNPFGVIPIVHIKNTADDLEFGVSDLQVMTPLQDALNKTITDMLLTMDQQSFQRAAVFGAQAPKGTTLSLMPGSVLEIPDPEGHLDVIEAASIEPFIAALKEIIDQIHAVTSTPKQALGRGESGVISGYALRVHYMPLERKCSKKRAIVKNRFRELDRLLFKAAALLGIVDYTGAGLSSKLHFGDALPLDEKEQTETLIQQNTAGFISRRSAMQKMGVEDVDKEMEQIETEDSGTYDRGIRSQQEGVTVEQALAEYRQRLTREPLEPPEG